MSKVKSNAKIGSEADRLMNTKISIADALAVCEKAGVRFVDVFYALLLREAEARNHDSFRNLVLIEDKAFDVTYATLPENPKSKNNVNFVFKGLEPLGSVWLRLNVDVATVMWQRFALPGSGILETDLVIKRGATPLMVVVRAYLKQLVALGHSITTKYPLLTESLYALR